MDEIMKTVADFYNIKISEIKSHRRDKMYALPRQIAMYLARNLTDHSYPEIGEKFGGKDHSTVIHNVQKIEKRMESDQSLKHKAVRTL
jgi:chromosomal replication initiator protein